MANVVVRSRSWKGWRAKVGDIAKEMRFDCPLISSVAGGGRGWTVTLTPLNLRSLSPKLVLVIGEIEGFWLRLYLRYSPNNRRLGLVTRKSTVLTKPLRPKIETTMPVTVKGSEEVSEITDGSGLLVGEVCDEERELNVAQRSIVIGRTTTEYAIEYQTIFAASLL